YSHSLQDPDFNPYCDPEGSEIYWLSKIDLITFKFARTGIDPGKKQCVLLKGVCKEGGCTSTDDTIGECSEEKKCCRKWWIFYPYATPVPKAKSP
uniref:Beta-defensin n=1 Tax=Suricata suricatta TaxID=37032 RepID=A0A673SSA3_SURSU